MRASNRCVSTQLGQPAGIPRQQYTDSKENWKRSRGEQWPAVGKATVPEILESDEFGKVVNSVWEGSLEVLLWFF